MKNENLVIGIIVLALILLFFGGFGMMGWGSYGMMGYAWPGMWLFGWLFMALIIVALVLLIAWLIKQLKK
jgi:uncharacterized membrane protein